MDLNEMAAAIGKLEGSLEIFMRASQVNFAEITRSYVEHEKRDEERQVRVEGSIDAMGATLAGMCKVLDQRVTLQDGRIEGRAQVKDSAFRTWSQRVAFSALLVSLLAVLVSVILYLLKQRG